MRRFHFNLQRVLEYREWREEAKKREFAAAQKARIEMEMHIAHRRVQLDEEKAALRKMERGAIDIENLRAQIRHIGAIEKSIRKSEQRLSELKGVEEEKRQELIQATKERKALENLRKRHLSEWKREADREERKFLDEIQAKPILERF